MNMFKVNGTEYNAKPFDFNLVCDLEDMGVSLDDMGTKKMSAIRGYFALCAGEDKEFAGKEINEHFINGGEIDGIVGAMSKEMEASDFFRALQKTTEKAVATDEEKAD